MESFPTCRRNVMVALKEGLHMRPLSMIVQATQRFAGEVTIRKQDGTSANAKNMFDLLALGADYGTQLVLEARGEGAVPLLQQLSLLFAANFQEGAPAGEDDDLSALDADSPSKAPLNVRGPCAQIADSE